MPKPSAEQVDDKVRTMLEEARAKRPNWREASPHDLRIRFVTLLAALGQHKNDTTEPTDADLKLWRVLDNDHL